MSYRYSGVGYDAVLSVDTAQRDSGGAAIPMLYLFDTADEVDETEAAEKPGSDSVFKSYRIIRTKANVDNEVDTEDHKTTE